MKLTRSGIEMSVETLNTIICVLFVAGFGLFFFSVGMFLGYSCYTLTALQIGLGFSGCFLGLMILTLSLSLEGHYKLELAQYRLQRYQKKIDKMEATPVQDSDQ